MLGNPPIESAPAAATGTAAAVPPEGKSLPAATPPVGGDRAPSREARPQSHAAQMGWPLAAATLALALIWIVAWYWQTAVGIVSIWLRSATFAHGFIVVPIACWLAWQRRALLAQTPPRPSALPLPVLLLAGAAWLVGETASVNALTQFALVTMLVASLAAIMGLRVTRIVLFPLLFLYFAVPFGEFVIPQLMTWTADFTVAALRLTGVPVYREGTFLVIPSGAWSVVEACSGARYLIASLVVGTLYAYISYRSLARRLLFVGCAIVVPIVANWMRAYMIVMLGHLSNNRLAAGVDHLIYGWVFFGVVIMLMFWIGGMWREDGPAVTAPRSPAPTPSLPAAAPPRWLPFAVAFLAVAVLTAAGPLIERRLDRVGTGLKVELGPIAAAPGWAIAAADPSAWRPAFETPSREQHVVATGALGRLSLHVLYYRDQSAQREMVSSMNQLVRSDDNTWTPISHGIHTVRTGERPLEVQATELVARGSSERRLVWKWYWVDGHLTASDKRAKAYTALARLQGHGDDSAALMLDVRYDSEAAPQAAALLEAFAQSHLSAILASLEGARRTR